MKLCAQNLLLDVKITIIDEVVCSKHVLEVKIVIIDEAVCSNLAFGCQNRDY